MSEIDVDATVYEDAYSLLTKFFILSLKNKMVAHKHGPTKKDFFGYDKPSDKTTEHFFNSLDVRSHSLYNDQSKIIGTCLKMQTLTYRDIIDQLVLKGHNISSTFTEFLHVCALAKFSVDKFFDKSELRSKVNKFVSIVAEHIDSAEFTKIVSRHSDCRKFFDRHYTVLLKDIESDIDLNEEIDDELLHIGPAKKKSLFAKLIGWTTVISVLGTIGYYGYDFVSGYLEGRGGSLKMPFTGSSTDQASTSSAPAPPKLPVKSKK